MAILPVAFFFLIILSAGIAGLIYLLVRCGRSGFVPALFGLVILGAVGLVGLTFLFGISHRVSSRPSVVSLQSNPNDNSQMNAWRQVVEQQQNAIRDHVEQRQSAIRVHVDQQKKAVQQHVEQQQRIVDHNLQHVENLYAQHVAPVPDCGQYLQAERILTPEPSEDCGGRNVDVVSVLQSAHQKAQSSTATSSRNDWNIPSTPYSYGNPRQTLHDPQRGAHITYTRSSVSEAILLAAMLALVACTGAFMKAVTMGHFRAWVLGGSLAVMLAGMCALLLAA
jgi:hypothetical protein